MRRSFLVSALFAATLAVIGAASLVAGAASADAVAEPSAVLLDVSVLSDPGLIIAADVQAETEAMADFEQTAETHSPILIDIETDSTLSAATVVCAPRLAERIVSEDKGPRVWTPGARIEVKPLPSQGALRNLWREA